MLPFGPAVAEGRATPAPPHFALVPVAAPDLDVYLPNLYRSESELIVLFLCPEYPAKRWCRLEWRHIRQLAEGHGERTRPACAPRIQSCRAVAKRAAQTLKWVECQRDEPLFLADIRLHRARLFGRVKGEEGRVNYPWKSPQEDLAEARGLIEKHGYGRRKEELEDAERALGAQR